MAVPATPSKVEPYIPASPSLPELTVGVIILGCLLSVILAGAHAYLGLFAGLTVSASVPAAVISMGICRLVRRGNILQNNAVQTAAASGEGLAAGVIFTLPALVILGTRTAFSYLATPLITGFGGAIIKVGMTGLKLWSEIVQFGGWLTGGKATAATKTAAATKAGAPFYFGINASPALISVGYIVGFNVATVIMLGSVLNRWIGVPLFSMFGDPTSVIVDPDKHTTLSDALVGLDPVAAADTIHGAVTRYLGVGGMLVGGLWSLFKLRKSLLGGVTAGLEAYRNRKAGAGSVLRTEHDLPMNVILILLAVSVIPLFIIFNHFA